MGAHAYLHILSPKHVLRSSLPLLQIEQQQQTSGYFHTLKGRRAALVVAVGEHKQMGMASADSFRVIARQKQKRASWPMPTQLGTD